jgi:hypothetical protein
LGYQGILELEITPVTKKLQQQFDILALAYLPHFPFEERLQGYFCEIGTKGGTLKLENLDRMKIFLHPGHLRFDLTVDSRSETTEEISQRPWWEEHICFNFHLYICK